MFLRQRHKPRFQVDVVQSSARDMLPLAAASTHRRKKRRFYVDAVGPQQSRFIPLGIAVEPPWIRRRLMTLGQRRIWRRWMLLLALTCIAVAVVVGGIYFAPLAGSSLTHSPARGSSSNGAGGVDLGRDPTLRRQAVPPFPSLQMHTPTSGSQSPTIQAAAAFVFDPGSGQIFYQKNADDTRSIASLTKMMTLLVAMNAGDLNQQVTISADAAALVNSQNSYMGVRTGETMSLRDLLYGLIVASGNDAAVAIADYIGGSEASFVTIMNRYARQLDLTHTVYVSPDGLDDGNKSSARDLAILGAMLMERPGVAEITSVPNYHIPQTDTHQSYDLWANNDLLPGGSAPYTGVNGIKTGFTDAAQYCMAFSARAQGHLIVGAVLGDPSAPTRNADAHALLDWAFSQE